MKLELKHLAPYLPYSLEAVACRVQDCQFVLEKMNQTKAYGYTKYGNFVPIGDLISEIKPILRPLSDLLNVDLDYLETDHETDYFVDNFGLLEYINSALNNNTLHNLIEFLPHGLVEWLISKHYDIYGLIEQGLAIDINTLDK